MELAKAAQEDLHRIQAEAASMKDSIVDIAFLLAIVSQTVGRIEGLNVKNLHRVSHGIAILSVCL